MVSLTLIHQLCRYSSVFLSVLLAAPVLAQTARLNLQPDNLTSPNTTSPSPDPAMAQITSVSQLSDVKPTDWAFEALQSLVERYGCIVGYPNRTFRGDQPLSRWEFAAGLNACLNSIERLISDGKVTKEDIDTLKRLTEQFRTELSTLGAKVDNLETRVAFLENHQFSTTTKLNGEVIFALTDAFQGAQNGSNSVFQYRVRLLQSTTFTGKDQLNTRLDAGNATRFNLGNGTPEGTQTFNLVPTLNNGVSIGWMSYYFPIGDRIDAYVGAVNGVFYDYMPTLNPYLDSENGGGKALTQFGSGNPIYQIGGGAGGGFNYRLTDKWIASVGYLAGNHANPVPGAGLFNGEYAAMAQIAWVDSQAGFGINYVRAYQNRGDLFDIGSSFGIVGTAQANNPFGTPFTSDSFGAQGFFTFSPGFALNGFFGYTNSNNLQGNGSANIWYYGLGFAFPDLGKAGNLGGLIFGVQPYLANNPAPANDMPFHIEAFYKYQVTNNISITPGVISVGSLILRGQKELMRVREKNTGITFSLK